MSTVTEQDKEAVDKEIQALKESNPEIFDIAKKYAQFTVDALSSQEVELTKGHKNCIYTNILMALQELTDS